MSLKEYDIVVVGPGDPEYAGMRGHVLGEVTAEQIGVFFDGQPYDAGLVCMHPDAVSPTGEVLPMDQRRDPSVRVRVSGNGEVLG